MRYTPERHRRATSRAVHNRSHRTTPHAIHGVWNILLRLTGLASAAIATSAAWTPDVLAQSAAGSEADEIIVTDGKGRELLQQAPVSVLAITDIDLERAGILDFDDLPQIAPSLTISKTTQPANNSINIRGIGTYAFSIAVEPSVAVVIDDIPQAFQAAAFTALTDVQQVEVLRGPQSTLFGKASSAGVIRLTTEPVRSTFGGRVVALASDDAEQRVQASISGPITSEVGYRFSANYSEFRGTLRNLTTGRWLNGQTDLNFRSKLEWRPTPALAVSVLPFWTRTAGTCCAAAETFVPAGATTGASATGPGRLPVSAFLEGITPGPDNRALRMDVDARGDARHRGVGLRAEYRRQDVSFLSLSSYEGYALTDRQDTDSTDIDFARFQTVSPPGGSANGGSTDVASRTQELRVQSAADGRRQFVGGVFWSSTRSKRIFVRGSNALDDYATATPPGFVGGPISPVRLPTTNDTTYSRYTATTTSENMAVFAQGSVPVSSTVDVLAGLRWGREAIGYTFQDQVNGVTFGSPRCAGETLSGLPIETCNRDTSLTGRLGLRIQPRPSLMLFGTYARGGLGQAYDLTSTLTLRTPAPATSSRAGLPLADIVAEKQPVPAEAVDSFEAGFKGVFLDRRLRLNVTAYDMRIANFQAQSRDLLLNQNVLNSLGRVSSRGVEAEVSARFGRLTVNGAAAYGQARIDTFPNASCYRGQTVAEGCVSGLQNLAGASLPNAPDLTFNIVGQYAAPVSGAVEAFATAAYRWQSEANFSLLQDPAARQSGYGVLNVAAGLQSDAWKVTLFANNLFKQRFLLNGGRDTHINNPPDTFATSWRPGRESQRAVGARLSYSF